MSKATDTRWRVQTKAKTGRWINRGLFETRAAARIQVRNWRYCYGLGTARVVRYVKGSK